MFSKRKSSKKSPAESLPSNAEAATAVAEAPASPATEDAGSGAQSLDASAAESRTDAPGFADRVGPRNPVPLPDPFVIATDNLAGIRLFESKQDRQMAIKFGEGRPEDKPSQAVIARLKEAGYRWNPADRIWAHKLRADSAMTTRIEAERLYQELGRMVRQEKGIAAGRDIPF